MRIGRWRLESLPKITLAVALTNLSVFCAMKVSGPIDQDSLIAWGAKAAPLIFDLGQSWRLVTASFLHENSLHITFNLFIFLCAGAVLEKLIKPVDYVFLLFASCLGATLASLWALPSAITVGASGIVYGVLGAAVILGLRYRRKLPQKYRRWLIGEAAIPAMLAFLYVGFTSSSVDGWAHLGGLAAGLFAGPFLELRPTVLEAALAQTASRNQRWLQRHPSIARTDEKAAWANEQIEQPKAAITGPGAMLRNIGGFAALTIAILAWIWLEGFESRLVQVEDDLFGVQAAVPKSWKRTGNELGQIVYSNGLSGIGRASLSIRSQILTETNLGLRAQLDPAIDPDSTWETPVQAATRLLSKEQTLGYVENLVVGEWRPVQIGENSAKVLDGAFRLSGRATKIQILRARRGEFVHEALFLSPADYSGYMHVVDKMLSQIKLVESDPMRDIRARALIAPGPATFNLLGDSLQRLGQSDGAAGAFDLSADLGTAR